MEHKALSIRPFIGAKDHDESRRFYSELGFRESVIESSMSVFYVNDSLSFYLQKAYVKDWVDNTMLFLEVENVEKHFMELQQLNLSSKFPKVRLSAIRHESWGSECFLHDPSGILWHFGEFNSNYIRS
jgi:hypothetical protein